MFVRSGLSLAPPQSKLRSFAIVWSFSKAQDWIFLVFVLVLHPHPLFVLLLLFLFSASGQIQVLQKVAVAHFLMPNAFGRVESNNLRHQGLPGRVILGFNIDLSLPP